MDIMPIANPFAEHFFRSYLTDHFLYKQYFLNNFFKKYNDLKDSLLEGLSDIDDAKVQKSLRLEIHATYFQAIETLFELIFGLEARNGIIDNRNLWYFISTSSGPNNYKKIAKIADGKIEFLHRRVCCGKDVDVSFLQYVFYFGLTDPDIIKNIQSSVEPIIKFIIAFAKDFSDRDEYNAFKHALRIIPLLKEVQMGVAGSNVPSVVLDMSEAFFILKKDDSGNGIILKARPLDTMRDLAMGTACSLLISNIINSRRIHFNKEDGDVFHFPSEESFNLANHYNLKWRNFNLSFTRLI